MPNAGARGHEAHAKRVCPTKRTAFQIRGCNAGIAGDLDQPMGGGKRCLPPMGSPREGPGLRRGAGGAAKKTPPRIDGVSTNKSLFAVMPEWLALPLADSDEVADLCPAPVSQGDPDEVDAGGAGQRLGYVGEGRASQALGAEKLVKFVGVERLGKDAHLDHDLSAAVSGGDVEAAGG